MKTKTILYLLYVLHIVLLGSDIFLILMMNGGPLTEELSKVLLGIWKRATSENFFLDLKRQKKGFTGCMG